MARTVHAKRYNAVGATAQNGNEKVPENATNKAVLMVAFFMPPSTVSSGHLRPLAFARHLPSFGWSPAALSASERVYAQIDPASVGLIPEACPVHRALALDASKSFSIHGKYPSVLAQPDRWSSWWPAAVCVGLRLIRHYRVRAIWSTYPIMTAHCVAHTLSRLTGLPWIADFRDPVAGAVAQHDKLTQSVQMRCERRVLSRAAYSVFTTPAAMRAYEQRYPQIRDEGRLKVISNGFDEADFADLPERETRQPGQPLYLLHSGVLYPHGRNPVPFFEALASLKDSGVLTVRDIKVTLRASGSEALYQVELSRLGLDEMVTLAPALPYREALAEQARADALLLFQGDEYDNQIPAKAYEYLRVGRPIFALAGARGDTAALLRDLGAAMLVAPEDVCGIRERLVEFVRAVRAGVAPQARSEVVARFSRQGGASMLAGLLDTL